MTDDARKNHEARARLLATDHVEWLMRVLDPLLKTEFAHGYKHGHEDATKEAEEKRSWP